jgi:hypothetical protein
MATGFASANAGKKHAYKNLSFLHHVEVALLKNASNAGRHLPVEEQPARSVDAK